MNQLSQKIKENCEYCFEKKKNCICNFNTCAECGALIPDSHASEYRGRIWCEGKHDFDEQVAKRDYERQEVMLETNHTTRSQADGEWNNGGYKTMKIDTHTGRPITRIKEPQRLKIYEGRN